MPPAIVKSKPKGRDGRQSRSRNTTPSSTVSAPITSNLPSHTALLDIPVSSLMIPATSTYDEILERHGGGGSMPEPRHLEKISNELKALAAQASERSEANNRGIRDLSEKRKQVIEDAREREQAARQREEKERETLKREAEDEDELRPASKLKKKKERSAAPEARPLNHGAHGLARQDGLDLPLDASPSKAAKASPRKHLDAKSGRSSSSLSEASPLPSPSAPSHPPQPPSARASSAESSSSSGSRQPPAAASITQTQTFGPNPLTFDDPTVYEVRPISDDMTDEEKKEIYCVSSFPHDDLRDLIAGSPPNKDFSHVVKPSNQVLATTFHTYLETYLRPLKEEDIGFLHERGDRSTPFTMPRRGKRHYNEVWAEEDGDLVPNTQENLPPNQARGSIDQMDDATAETEQISSGPMMSRLLSTMRVEQRPPATEEKPQTNGLTNGTTETLTNGDLPNGTSHSPLPPDDPTNKLTPLPPATSLPESSRPTSTAPQLTPAQMDERVKLELRHLGFLSPEQPSPDYDAHYDDEVAERLRFLQDRLREVSVLNGARKQRVLELAQEQQAYQEYSTILEDLDEQVKQAYMKRARTAGKSKKNAKRPGGAGGGSNHVTQGGVSMAGTGAGAGGVGGVSKPGIGDLARQLMARRARWESQIGPVFRGDIRRVRGAGETIFGNEGGGVMGELARRERERWDDEVDG